MYFTAGSADSDVVSITNGDIYLYRGERIFRFIVQKLGSCKVWKFLKLGTCNCKYPWVVANVTHGYLQI